MHRFTSKLGDIDAFGADPRRVATAGHDVENIEPIDFGTKYKNQNDAFKARYDSLGSKFNGKRLDDYVNGKSFCCGENSLDEIEKNNNQGAENAKFEDNLYFYHPDHLGSTNLITNFDGEVTQSVAYVPYGEVFVEERNGSWATPYLFNAKELDEETGLYYYGARYLDPTDCRWLAVDPVFHPGASPYAYCLGNPVRLVDPDGREEYFSEKGDHVGSGTNKDDKAKYVVSDKKEVKTIKKNGKSGSDTDVKDLKSAYKLPSDATLKEALDVLDRTINNGGGREENSLVKRDGSVERGTQGEEVTQNSNVAVSSTVAYNNDDNSYEASIHSHPLVYFTWEGGYKKFDSSYTSDNDVNLFSNFEYNLIVGKKGNLTTNYCENCPSPKPIIGYSDNRPLGVSFYGRNVNEGQAPSLWLSKKAVSNILKK